GRHMALSTGIGFGLSGGNGSFPTGFTWSEPTTDWSKYETSIADFNGDGKADLFMRGTGACQGYDLDGNCVGGNAIGAYMDLSTGTGFQETWSLDYWSALDVGWNPPDVTVGFADFNGDGSADLFRIRSGGCGIGGCGYYLDMALSTGTGFLSDRL